jgi:hypothetical protein
MMVKFSEEKRFLHKSKHNFDGYRKFKRCRYKCSGCNRYLDIVGNKHKSHICSKLNAKFVGKEEDYKPESIGFKDDVVEDTHGAASFGCFSNQNNKIFLSTEVNENYEDVPRYNVDVNFIDGVEEGVIDNDVNNMTTRNEISNNNNTDENETPITSEEQVDNNNNMTTNTIHRLNNNTNADIRDSAAVYETPNAAEGQLQNLAAVHETPNTAEEEVINEVYCGNCKRLTTLHISESASYKKLYTVMIADTVMKKTSLRRKFSTLSLKSSEVSLDLFDGACVRVKLCVQCTIYLTTTPQNKTSKMNGWPALFWKILSSSNLYRMYGQNLWQIIPDEWRQWWIKSVTILLPYGMYHMNELTNMTYKIVDVTLRKDNLQQSIQSGKLGDIMESCNKNLLPLVKCPWGCTEYFHSTGELSMQVLMTRFITAHESLLFFTN